jgi:hypothetical protein
MIKLLPYSRWGGDKCPREQEEWKIPRAGCSHLGGERQEYIEDGEIYGSREIEVDGLTCNNTTNPHVIIEFSWTNDWQNKFLKTKEQVKARIPELGRIQVDSSSKPYL